MTSFTISLVRLLPPVVPVLDQYAKYPSIASRIYLPTWDLFLLGKRLLAVYLAVIIKVDCLRINPLKTLVSRFTSIFH